MLLNTNTGNKRRRKTTKGWHLCVQWFDGSTTWECLADMKQSYPLAVARYATENDLSSFPAFAWWVPTVLQQKKKIISEINKPVFTYYS